MIKRIINLDPGYLTKHNVILATAKEMPHKVFIGQGMFGDVVLIYRKRSYIISEHTFQDYQQDHVKQFLLKIRQKYIQQLKEVEK